MAELTAKFKKNVRPLIDALEKLRHINVTSEIVPPLKIVLIGEQFSGKTSVLESLISIRLGGGQNSAARYPLVLQLERSKDSMITISFGKAKRLPITEDQIRSKVEFLATQILAGNTKGVVTDTHISLLIRKPDAPDLTIIDLPGITDGAASIHEQIAAMNTKDIHLDHDTLLLNVLSATVDFAKCNSIRMCRDVDKKELRTWTVITKVDISPNEAYEKVTTGNANISLLGYICVRNRIIANETFTKAREEEKTFFESDPLLSQLDKAAVGIPALAELLTQVQANTIRSRLPGIQEQIDSALLEKNTEFKGLDLFNDKDLKFLLIYTVDKTRDLMQAVMNRNYGTFVGQKEMHYPARMVEIMLRFSNNLLEVLDDMPDVLQRITQMEELTSSECPSRTLMTKLVSEKINKVSEYCTNLVLETTDYARKFLVAIVEESTNAFPNLQAAYKKEAQKILDTHHENSMKYVLRVLEKEKTYIFTWDYDYIENVSIRLTEDTSAAEVKGFKERLAIETEAKLAEYCKIVHKRMVDSIAMELRFSLENAFVSNLRKAILETCLNQNLECLMREIASTTQKRQTLGREINILNNINAKKLF